MAKLLMSCDDRLFLYNGQYYAADNNKYEFYQRYLRVFDTLRLVCRCEAEKELKACQVPLAEDSRIEVVPVPLFQGPREYARVFFSVGRAMKNAVKGCDAAIFRIPSTVALRIGNKARKAGIPYACEVVFDAQDGWKGSKGINRMAWKMIDKQMRRLCSTADGISCVTENYLQQHYFPYKTDAFTSNYSSLALPKSFYTAPRCYPQKGVFFIAHTANQVDFNGRKGHNEILYALKILKERGVRVMVRFAGKDYFGGIGKLRKLANELGVSEMVRFVGYLNREELSVFLNEADLYVMPTRAEGLPRVVIEAMAKGLPCITTPVSGNPELIDNHFLVPYENIDMLADRIEELLTMPDVYEQASCVNYERSQKYEASFLQSRRDEFYSKLKERAQKQ